MAARHSEQAGKKPRLREILARQKYMGHPAFGLRWREIPDPAMEQIIKRGGQLGTFRTLPYGMPHRGVCLSLATFMQNPIARSLTESGGSFKPMMYVGPRCWKYTLGAVL